jgi:hypothetical protein
MNYVFKTKKFAGVATAAALLAIGGGVSVAASDDATPEPPSASERVWSAALNAPTPTSAVAAVPADAKASFRLFREQPATPMPADVAAQIGSPKRFGRNPNLARKITTVTGDGWVIPGNGWVCIAIPDPVDSYGTTCQPIADAARRGIAIGLSGGDGIPAGKSAQVALLPDDVAQARAAEVRASGPGAPGVVSAFVDAGDDLLAPAGE